MCSTADFLQRLHRFVESESDAQRYVLERQWARPLGQRVSKGWTNENLRVVKFDKSSPFYLSALNTAADSQFECSTILPFI